MISLSMFEVLSVLYDKYKIVVEIGSDRMKKFNSHHERIFIYFLFFSMFLRLKLDDIIFKSWNWNQNWFRLKGKKHRPKWKENSELLPQ